MHTGTGLRAGTARVFANTAGAKEPTECVLCGRIIGPRESSQPFGKGRRIHAQCMFLLIMGFHRIA